MTEATSGYLNRPVRTEFEARCDIARKKFPLMFSYQIEGMVRLQMRHGRLIIVESNPYRSSFAELAWASAAPLVVKKVKS